MIDIVEQLHSMATHWIANGSDCDRAADEIEKLRAEIANLQQQLDASCNAEELRQVRAESEALRKDAERHRGIHLHTGSSDSPPAHEGASGGCAIWNIDAAMKGEKE